MNHQYRFCKQRREGIMEAINGAPLRRLHFAGFSHWKSWSINLPVERCCRGGGGRVGAPHLEQLLEYGHAVDEGRLAEGATGRVGQGPEIRRHSSVTFIGWWLLYFIHFPPFSTQITLDWTKAEFSLLSWPRRVLVMQSIYQSRSLL